MNMYSVFIFHVHVFIETLWLTGNMADEKPIKVGTRVEVVGKGVTGKVAYIGSTLFSSGKFIMNIFYTNNHQKIMFLLVHKCSNFVTLK